MATTAPAQGAGCHYRSGSAKKMMQIGSGIGGKTAPWRQDMIKRAKNGYQVLSRKGRNLGGPQGTLEEASSPSCVFQTP